MTEPVHLDRGLPQGCPASPVIFEVVLEKVLRDLTWSLDAREAWGYISTEKASHCLHLLTMSTSLLTVQKCHQSCCMNYGRPFVELPWTFSPAHASGYPYSLRRRLRVCWWAIRPYRELVRLVSLGQWSQQTILSERPRDIA